MQLHLATERLQGANRKKRTSRKHHDTIRLREVVVQGRKEDDGDNN